VANIDQLAILLIDDDLPLRTAFSKALEREGHLTEGIDGSIDVIQKIEKFAPDLVLMDNHMPGKSGLQILELIRAKWSKEELPVVLVSGSTMQDEVDKALNSGVNAFRRKPVELWELVETVNMVIGSVGVESSVTSRVVG